jgi:hypothetical protein
VISEQTDVFLQSENQKMLALVRYQKLIYPYSLADHLESTGDHLESTGDRVVGVLELSGDWEGVGSDPCTSPVIYFSPKRYPCFSCFISCFLPYMSIVLVFQLQNYGTLTVFV